MSMPVSMKAPAALTYSAAYDLRSITQSISRFQIPRLLTLSSSVSQQGVEIWPFSVRAPRLASNFSRAKSQR